VSVRGSVVYIRFDDHLPPIYFATRGAAAGTVADDIHYPGAYLAGGYNRLRTHIAGRVGVYGPASRSRAA